MYTGLHSNILNGIYIMTIEKPKQTKHLALSVSGVTAELKSEYLQLAKKRGMTQGEFARVLLENYKNFNVDLTKTDADTIKQALRIAPLTYKSKLKKVILSCANSVVSSNEADASIDTTKINSAKAADKRVDDLLELMFKQNETATSKNGKTFISKSSFLDFISKTKESGAIEVVTSKAVINRCLERRSSLIEAHHAEHELNVSHNLKAHYARLKAAIEINEKTEV